MRAAIAKAATKPEMAAPYMATRTSICPGSYQRAEEKAPAMPASAMRIRLMETA